MKNLILELRKWRQKGKMFKAILNYMANPWRQPGLSEILSQTNKVLPASNNKHSSAFLKVKISSFLHEALLK